MLNDVHRFRLLRPPWRADLDISIAGRILPKSSADFELFLSRALPDEAAAIAVRTPLGIFKGILCDARF